LPAENAARLAAAMSKQFGEGFLDDVEVWKHKTRIENPLLTEEDGPVYQHRRWYEQFYVDVADVTAEMTDRFEVEVDTTHANVAWQREVAENLRSKADSANSLATS
jgi:3-ketosteroid 9alpha-monooxygenase subunit A